MIDNQTKLVFISYSRKKKERVEQIVQRLMECGIQVRFDLYDLDPGNDVTAFMEKSVVDPDVDYILCFCDASYTDKANSRSGGVGAESTILSQEVYTKVEQRKIVPVIIESRDGSPCVPVFLKSLYHIDMADDNDEEGFESLVRHIYEKPKHRRPMLGLPPAWLDDEDVNYAPLRELVNQVRSHRGTSTTSLVDVVMDLLSELVAKEITDMDSYRSIIDEELTCRNLIIEYFETILKHGESMGSKAAELLEELKNGLQMGNDHRRQDLVDFFIWEFTIVLSSLALKYKDYRGFESIISKTYFIESRMERSHTFDCLYCYASSIEDWLKPQVDPKKLSLQAEMLSHRPFGKLDIEAFSSTDLILYHLSVIRKADSHWFPLLYVYHKGGIDLWKRMQSRQHCQDVAILFGTDSIQSLKDVIDHTKDPQDGFPRAWSRAPWITEFIEGDVGKYP